MPLLRCLLLACWLICCMTSVVAQPLRIPPQGVYLDTAIDLRAYAQVWVPSPTELDRKPWQGMAPTFRSPEDWQPFFDGL